MRNHVYFIGYTISYFIDVVLNSLITTWPFNHWYIHPEIQASSYLLDKEICLWYYLLNSRSFHQTGWFPIAQFRKSAIQTVHRNSLIPIETSLRNMGVLIFRSGLFGSYFIPNIRSSYIDDNVHVSLCWNGNQNSDCMWLCYSTSMS